MEVFIIYIIVQHYIYIKRCLSRVSIPSFSPCDLYWQNSPARLVTFSQSYLCCYLPSEDRCHGNNELKNIGLFLYFLEFPSVKICTGEVIDLMLLIPYFLKILWSNDILNIKIYKILAFKKICSIKCFDKIL